MAMGRLNRPSIMLYGGTIAPGHYKGEDLNIISAFEALGQKIAGNLSEADFKGIVKHACPGAGACGGMYTANTMASAIEALGMSLPYSSSNPALSEDKQKECAAAGKGDHRCSRAARVPAAGVPRRRERAVSVLPGRREGRRLRGAASATPSPGCWRARSSCTAASTSRPGCSPAPHTPSTMSSSRRSCRSSCGTPFPMKTCCRRPSAASSATPPCSSGRCGACSPIRVQRRWRPTSSTSGST